MLAVGPLGILFLHCRDLDHLAVITLAAQPAKKGAFEQLGVEPVSLGAPNAARIGLSNRPLRLRPLLARSGPSPRHRGQLSADFRNRWTHSITSSARAGFARGHRNGPARQRLERR